MAHEPEDVRRAIGMVKHLAQHDWRDAHPELEPLMREIEAFVSSSRCAAKASACDTDEEDVPPGDDHELPTARQVDYHEMLSSAARALDGGEFDAARRHLDCALEVVPDSARARRLLASLLEKSGDLSGAYRVLAEAQSIDYSPDLHEHLEELKVACDRRKPETAPPEAPTAAPSDFAAKAVSDLLGTDAIKNLMQNPQIIQMAQNLSGDPSMRAMMDGMFSAQR